MTEEFRQETGLDAPDKEPLALLVGVYKGGANKTLCEEHLDELENLADTFGVPILEKLACPLKKIEAATYLSSGKIEEIATLVANHGVTLIIFDEEISPAQQRNLEKRLKVAVMDRTELILEIFAERAQTKEARLQIELAQTKYEFPRLKRLWSHFSRQRMSGGFLKGEGEKQIEIDKRLLQRKIERLSKELKQVAKYRETQTSARRRASIPTFAIIGYTNAGKSTLLNALTEADVFVEDKLFATLDPTTRKFTLPNNQEILFTDTVGFIRKLPHTLVAAFRSTLEAALHDDFLLHLIDVSHKSALAHAEETMALLKELNAEEAPIITVLNKIDACNDPTVVHQLRLRFPKTIEISALKKQGFEDLTSLLINELEKRRKTIKLKIPQQNYALVTKLYRVGYIHSEEYEDNDVILKVDVPLSLLHQLDQYLLKS